MENSMAEDAKQTVQKQKSKGELKSTFVWDSSEKGQLKHKPIGKRSTMAKWDQEFRRAEALGRELQKQLKSKAKEVKIGKVRDASHD
jgi:hypothetical protein